MQWVSKQIEQFQSNPEFFDTAIIPCYRVSTEDGCLDLMNQNEKLMDLVIQLEDRLKGRIVLFPAVVLFGTSDPQLKAMVDETSIEMKKFKYLFYIPFDELIHKQLNEFVICENGHVLTISNKVDWYQEIVSLWTKK